MSFSDFNLNKDFIQAIEAAGYESPTDLQAQLIPLVEEKKSALIWSQSASGKTGAFLIPAMNYILENPAPEKRGARILVLTSRRDRVSQINYTIKRLSTELTMRFGFIVSGRPYQTQMRLMRRPLDIMIATPGRLNDLMNNGKADFSQLEMLVVDDLTSIYRKNLQGLIENILKQAGPDCSAITFVTDDEEVTPYAKNLYPGAEQITVDEFEGEVEIEVSQKTQYEQPPQINTQHQQGASDNHYHNNDFEKNAPQEQVSNKKPQQDQSSQNNNKPQTKTIDITKLMPQKVHIADDYTHKIAMMDHLMDEFAGKSTIIYTATDKAAKSLQENLSNHGHEAELIDEVDKDELNEFDILIYSDQSKVDIDNELMANLGTNIINFDLPHNVDHYIERLNRHDQERENPTLLILDGYNFNELKSLEKAFNDKIDQITIPGLEPLKPFVNLSRGRAKSTNNSNKNSGKKPVHSNQKRRGTSANKAGAAGKTGTANRGRASKAGGRNSNNKGAQAKNAQGQDATNTSNKKPRRNNKASGRTQNNNKPGQKEGDTSQKRQHKGPFGRLNGGTHRKSTNSRNRNVGVSRVGTDAPKGREGKSLAAEVNEKSADTGSKVKISYNKKRTLTMEKPEEL